MLVKSKQVRVNKPGTTEMCKDINNESGKWNNGSTVEAWIMCKMCEFCYW